MISLNNFTFEFGSRALYDDANWHIKPGEKIGLIGANGTGKTTLLKILVGEYSATSGTISKAKDLRIGYLNQDLLSYQSDNSILHVAMEAFERQNKLHAEIDVILKKIETDYNDDLLHKLSDKQQEFELLDGYNIQYKAEQILAGLGFSAEQTAKPLSTFSGGWRMRVMLAKILLQAPDLLLLDEPTNHLDLPSIKWLENYLLAFEGAYIIVSHDRYFLDKTVSKIVESKGGDLIQYAGNYSFYLEEKALREEIQSNQFKNQQKKIKEEEKLIDRFRAKASKAKMVQSRIKALDKIERVDDVDDDNPSVSFKFSFTKQSGRQVVELKNISKSYPNLDIMENTSGIIERGDKIALIGANGKGKSTLLRIIANTDSNIKGEVVPGYNVNQAFFAQHQLESLNVNNTILEELQQFAPLKNDTELRSILGCFLFTGDDVFKKIRVLSGGEKSRVALSKILISDSNFLILDEPTNHLDIQSVNILIQALKQYEGTFVLVSHDRYLIENVANKIWYIEDKEIKQYPGTYEEYEWWEEKRRKEALTQSSKVTEKVAKKQNDKADPRQNEKDKQREIKKLNQDLALLEEQISSLEIQKKKIEEDLSKDEVFSSPNKLKEVNNEYSRIKNELLQIQNKWESIANAIMELE